MKNLVNLVKLQYYSILSLKRYFLIILAIGLVMIINDPSIFLFPIALLLMGLCYTTSVYEEKSKANYLIYSLPVKASDYVLSKYLFGLFNTLLGIILCTLLFIACNEFNIVDFNGMPLSAVILSLFSIGIFLTAIVIPLGLIIGFEKSRLLMVFLTVLPVTLSDKLLEIISNFKITFSPSTITLLVMLGGLTITLASYFITSNMCSKRDVS